MKNPIFILIMALFVHYQALSLPATGKVDNLELNQLITNLYIIATDKTPVLMDGTLTQFGAEHSDAVDGKDARKMFNPSENWGIQKENAVLIIERRSLIKVNDTIFFKFWNSRVITYRAEFIAYNLNAPGRVAFLEDNYLKTSRLIQLNDTTTYDFSVTKDPESKAVNRFRIVFSGAVFGPLPLKFTETNAFQKSSGVEINWKTANEINVKQIDIERSNDGIAFEKINSIQANNTPASSYLWIDKDPLEGNNFYRLRSIDLDGKMKLSDIVKVRIVGLPKNISVFPNPVIGNNANLQFANQEPGVFEVKWISSFGQVVTTQRITHSGGNSIYRLNPARIIPKGIYRIDIKSPTGERKVISVVY